MLGIFLSPVMFTDGYPNISIHIIRKTNIGRSYAFRSVFSPREVGEASFGRISSAGFFMTSNFTPPKGSLSRFFTWHFFSKHAISQFVKEPKIVGIVEYNW